MFEIVFTARAQQDLEHLEATPRHEALVKQIKKSLAYLQNDPKHPSLQTHSYSSIENPLNPKEKVFEAYAQNRTPAAYRIAGLIPPLHEVAFHLPRWGSFLVIDHSR